jgi:hypothetical protein
MTSIKLVVENSEAHWEEFSSSILENISYDKEFQKECLEDIVNHIVEFKSCLRVRHSK